MTQLSTTFANKNGINLTVALNAAAGELASIEAQINNGTVVSATLLMRRAQLKQMIAELRARSTQGQASITRDDDNAFFAVLAAMIYTMNARKAAQRTQRARQIAKKRSLRAQFAPKLAA